VRHAMHSTTCRGSHGLAGSPAARDRVPSGVIDEVGRDVRLFQQSTRLRAG
jgi:hypothetical protein